MNPAIGVDLGTTNTVVASQTDITGATLVGIPQPIEQRSILDFSNLLKSAVYFESEDLAVVGTFASRRLGAFKSIKSKIGTRWRVPHPFACDQMLDPAYISGHILRVAFNAVLKRFPKWDRTALLTVPASFNTDQRLDTLKAARLAGFEDVRLLDEPTAAFYFYFDQNRESLSLNRSLSVLVFDFGGGTLDVSVIQVERNNEAITIDAIGRSRYNNLGGDDIDLDVAAFLLGCWELQTGKELDELPPEFRKQVFQLFLERASLFKEEVEDAISNALDIPEFLICEELIVGGTPMRIELHRRLSRAQYDEVTGRFLRDKHEVNIYRPIGQAIDIASRIRPGFSTADLDFILLTGGASRMTAVRAALQCFFSPKRCFSLSDEEACSTVALGAACCRYDELHRREQVRMTARMLESVLTRSDDGMTYVPLVPIDCEPTFDFVKVEHEFTTRRDIIKLRLPLFRGTGPSDPQLNPMRDCEIELRRIVKRDTPYHVYFRMTSDKTLQLKVRFQTQEGDLEETADLELDHAALSQRDSRDLATINAIRGH